MSTEIQKRQDLNRQMSVGERVLRDTGVRGLVASDLPASEVIGSLTKRVREAKHVSEKYEYLAPTLFGKNMVFDGLLDVTYGEMVTTDASKPYTDVVIEDFNSTPNKAVRFTYEAKTESNVKTKILNDVLMNFKTNPSDAVANIFKGTENINKTQSVRWANQVWNELASRSVEVDVTGMEDVATTGDSVNKEIYKVLKEFGKNSKSHIGVGTDPVTTPGAIVAGENTVTPTYKFKSSDFYLLTTVDFDANTRFDGEKVLYNYGNGVQDLALAGHHTIYLDDEEFVGTDAATNWEGAKAVLVHKDAVMGIQDWVGTGMNNAGKLYSTFINYMKQDTVPRYDAPVIVFKETVAPAARKAE